MKFQLLLILGYISGEVWNNWKELYPILSLHNIMSHALRFINIIDLDAALFLQCESLLPIPVFGNATTLLIFYLWFLQRVKWYLYSTLNNIRRKVTACQTDNWDEGRHFTLGASNIFLHYDLYRTVEFDQRMILNSHNLFNNNKLQETDFTLRS